MHDERTVAAADAPRTETERALLAIWSAVLSCEQIGVHDDFLDLGGDSLAAMRCINRVRKQFGVHLSLDLFLLPPAHIADIAAQLDQMQDEGADA